MRKRGGQFLPRSSWAASGPPPLSSPQAPFGGLQIPAVCWATSGSQLDEGCVQTGSGPSRCARCSYEHCPPFPWSSWGGGLKASSPILPLRPTFGLLSWTCPETGVEGGVELPLPITQEPYYCPVGVLLPVGGSCPPAVAATATLVSLFRSYIFFLSF